MKSLWSGYSKNGHVTTKTTNWLQGPSASQLLPLSTTPPRECTSGDVLGVTDRPIIGSFATEPSIMTLQPIDFSLTQVLDLTKGEYRSIICSACSSAAEIGLGLYE